MTFLKVLLCLLLLTLLALTAHAVVAQGLSGGNIFFTDFTHPWRAQFNADLSIHLLLFACWVAWREHTPAIGLICALACALGGLFTLPYLLVAALRARGNATALLMGRHAPRPGHG